jgi:hypothetical protein
MIEGKEENLPKEKGRYAVGIKGTPFSPLYLNAEDFNPAEDITKAKCNYRSSAKYWLESFDSYLQPVQLSVPSEELKKELLKQINHSKEVISEDNSPMSETTIEHSGIIMAYEYMLEWLQSHPSEDLREELMKFAEHICENGWDGPVISEKYVDNYLDKLI